MNHLSHVKTGIAYYIDTMVIDYIRRLGNATSLGLLHPKCLFFKEPSIDGIIGYRIERGCLVAIGDPVCSLSDRMALAQAFQDFCKDQNKKSMYVMVSESFTNQMLDCYNGSAFQFGDEIIIDPTIDTKSLSGRNASHLRQRYRKALSSGLSCNEYDNNTPEITQTLTAIMKRWTENRKGPQIFLLPLEVAYASSNRWFYAKKDNEIVAFLMLNQIGALNGWALNGTIILTPEAPKGTSELLMIYTLETLRNEGCNCLSIGPALSTQIGRIDGFGWFSEMLIKCTLTSVRNVFKMHERQRFWKKFQPRKEPSFLLFNTPRVRWQEIHALLRTFNASI
ncbi:MAG TPA: DUF2156 domain-containing protein [Candidatus Babeliales bacterium]|nr:DUF2156 domain-containing protein [Candidatus Babeliales bacterium]